MTKGQLRPLIELLQLNNVACDRDDTAFTAFCWDYTTDTAQESRISVRQSVAYVFSSIFQGVTEWAL